MPIVKNLKGHQIIEVSNLKSTDMDNILSNDTLHLSNEASMLSKLDDVVTNTGNISISADSVNLNVDDLEGLQTNANSSLSSLDSKVVAVDTSGKSTEAKQDDIITALAGVSSLDSKVVAVDTSGKSTEAKQDDIITALAGVSSLDTKVVAVDTSGKSTEAKQDDIITALSSVDSTLTSQATATKQDLIISHQDKKEITETNCLSNFSLSAGAQLTSTTKVVSGAKHLCVVGKETAYTGSRVELYGGNSVNTLDQYFLGVGYFVLSPAPNNQSVLEFGHINNICFSHCFVKIINQSSTSSNVTVKLLTSK